jgi:hypothetical protein
MISELSYKVSHGAPHACEGTTYQSLGGLSLVRPFEACRGHRGGEDGGDVGSVVGASNALFSIFLSQLHRYVAAIPFIG